MTDCIYGGSVIKNCLWAFVEKEYVAMFVIGGIVIVQNLQLSYTKPYDRNSREAF